MKKLLTIYLVIAGGLLPVLAQETPQPVKLTGKVIGTTYSVDYSSGNKTTTVNTKENAFDGDLETYFASYDRSNTWVGYDLEKSYRITRVGWSPRNDSNGPSRVVLGLFEGANTPTFTDAVPLYLNTQSCAIGQMYYADVNVNRTFRYVRYLGPSDARCNIAELEFYGYETSTKEKKEQLYQVTNLPLVVIHTKSGADPADKINDLDAYISIISNNGKTLVEDTCTVRLRGNASAKFEKKPYRFKLNHKSKLLGSPAKAKKWTLINNYGDKTLMRNLLAFQISKMMEMEYTPFGTPVDVIMNGEYKGCYQLCDQIEVGKGRVEIEEMDSTVVSGEELTGGYLIEIDAYAYDETSYFYSNKNNPVTIKYPKDDEINEKQASYIKGRFNSMEARVLGASYADEVNGYRPYLHLDSFLKHFLVGETSGNTDTYWSVYMYKHRSNDLFYTGPVWDFDIAFENDNRTYPINNKTDFVYRSGGSCAGNMKSFVDCIVINDTKARTRMKELWSNARNTKGLTADSLVSYINEMAQTLNASQKLNFTRWNILNKKVHQNPATYGSYQGEVNNVINFIRKRIEWMDNKVGYDPTYTGIETLEETDVPRCETIYRLTGEAMPQTSVEALPTGIYVVGGKIIARQ